MDSARWKRLDDLFAQAVEMSPSERSAFLDKECADDPDLRLEIDSLIEAEAGATIDFQTAIREAAGELVSREETEAGVGDRLGEYRLRSKLGQGGMGTVFLADRADQEFDFVVAVKILRGAVHEETLERFRVERQILADLRHPYIARLLDGGASPDGSPFVVMEYVDGLPLDDYCNRHRLGVRQRVELFRKVLGGGGPRPPATDCSPRHQAGQYLGRRRRQSQAAGLRNRQDP